MMFVTSWLSAYAVLIPSSRICIASILFYIHTGNPAGILMAAFPITRPSPSEVYAVATVGVLCTYAHSAECACIFSACTLHIWNSRGPDWSRAVCAACTVFMPHYPEVAGVLLSAAKHRLRA